MIIWLLTRIPRPLVVAGYTIAIVAGLCAVVFSALLFFVAFATFCNFIGPVGVIVIVIIACIALVAPYVDEALPKREKKQ